MAVEVLPTLRLLERHVSMVINWVLVVLLLLLLLKLLLVEQMAEIRGRG